MKSHLPGRCRDCAEKFSSFEQPYQLDRAGLGNATVQLLLNCKCAELDGLMKQSRVAANDRKDDHTH